MWKSTPSTSDNKQQNIEEISEVNGLKRQQQKNNSKRQTSKFGGQIAASNKPEDGCLDEGVDGGKFSELVDETIDSGCISGPLTSSSSNLDTGYEGAGITSCELRKLNITEPAGIAEVYEKTQQELNTDSGVIEEIEHEENKCDLEKQHQSNETRMRLPNNVDSGISEWFCNLSLQNNPNASREQANPALPASRTVLNNLNAPIEQQQPVQQANSSHAVGADPHYSATLPQQITPANAWEKYYQQNDDGDTPLHLACISGYEDVVTALIRMAPHPCLFNIQNDAAQTPLHLATLTSQPKIIRMLLIAGAKPTVRDRHGNTALHLACMSGEEQCVRALTIPISASEINEAHRQYGHRANDKSYLKCAQLPTDLEIRNYDGERCVHLAAQAGFINILQILVLYGADINAREGKSGFTPLHIAIESCNDELVNFLLDDCQKLNLETASYAGLTAYQIACMQNKSEIQNILTKRGAEPITPPDSDYDNSDVEIELDDSKIYDRFGDPGYFVGYKGGNAMTVA